jgi:hypothetical protein
VWLKCFASVKPWVQTPVSHKKGQECKTDPVWGVY